jgi:hypothetical protein
MHDPEPLYARDMEWPLLARKRPPAGGSPFVAAKSSRPMRLQAGRHDGAPRLSQNIENNPMQSSRAASWLAHASGVGPDLMRVRGTVERAEAPLCGQDARRIGSQTDRNRPPVCLSRLSPATMSDIKPGMFVGSVGVMQKDGTQKAIGVHIFPEAMRVTGEAITIGTFSRKQDDQRQGRTCGHRRQMSRFPPRKPLLRLQRENSTQCHRKSRLRPDRGEEHVANYRSDA